MITEATVLTYTKVANQKAPYTYVCQLVLNTKQDVQIVFGPIEVQEKSDIFTWTKEKALLE